jgi:Ca2+-binding EF-hand superfamily protein
MSFISRPSAMMNASGLDDIGGVKYSVKDIEKEREFEKKKQKMIEEFKVIDRNSDENITLDEWLEFLKTKVLVTLRVSLRDLLT